MNPQLYNLIFKKIAILNCSSDQLSNLKEIFDFDILSKRRLDYINSLEELLVVLRKRDLINPNNITKLIKIITILNEPEILTLLLDQSVPNNCNSKMFDSSSLTDESKKLVHKLISEEIGYRWKDFARALNMKEGFIDYLNGSFTPADRIYRILLLHEEKYFINNARLWKTKLLEALSNSRRNDIRKRAEEIFDI